MTIAPSETPQGSSSGIVFVLLHQGYSNFLNIPGKENVFFANADGSGLRPITKDGLLGYIRIKDISPDYKQLLIQSGQDFFMEGASYLYIANIDGSGVTKIVTEDYIRDAIWLKKTNKIAFVANNHINLINPDGKGLTIDKWQHDPVYFPNNLVGEIGDQVVFEIAKGSPLVSYTWDNYCTARAMKTDGSGLVSDLGITYHMEISPNHSFIAHAYGGGDQGNIWIDPLSNEDGNIIVDTKNEKSIPIKLSGNFNYYWSPDSSYLWVEEKIENNTDIYNWKPGDKVQYKFYIWKINESKVIEIAPLEEDVLEYGYNLYGNEAISPDGKQILFTHGGNYIAIYDIETNQLSLEFGCAIRKSCPPQPIPVIGGANYWQFLYSVYLNTPFWLPNS